jgi:WD40 repeat protein
MQSTEWRRVGDLGGHQAPVRAIAWSPDGARLASCAEDGAVFGWNLDAKRGRLLYHVPGRVFSRLAWSPDGALVATIGGGYVVVLRWEGGLVAATAHDETSLNDVAWSPDGRLLAAAGTSGRVHLQQAPGLLRAGVLDVPGGPAEGVRWSPDGRRLAVFGDGRVRLFEPGEHEVVGGFETPRLADLAWLPDGERLVAGGADGGLRIVDRHGRTFRSLPDHAGLAGLSIDRAGRRVATLGDGILRLHDLRDDGAPVALPAPGCGAVALHPDRACFVLRNDARRLLEVWDGEGVSLLVSAPKRPLFA